MSLLLKDNSGEAKRTGEPANGTNPWVKIDQTVHQVDEEKVKDSTANLDALLVFAGLYSAILTAFLIESSKNLQSDLTEQLLRQIAGQTANYSFHGGYLNSTYNPSQMAPFEVATSDIPVNVCWLASLIFKSFNCFVQPIGAAMASGIPWLKAVALLPIAMLSLLAEISWSISMKLRLAQVHHQARMMWMSLVSAARPIFATVISRLPSHLLTSTIPAPEQETKSVTSNAPLIPLGDLPGYMPVTSKLFTTHRLTFAFLDFLSARSEHLSRSGTPANFLPDMVGNPIVWGYTDITVPEILVACAEYFKHKATYQTVAPLMRHSTIALVCLEHATPLLDGAVCAILESEIRHTELRSAAAGLLRHQDMDRNGHKWLYGSDRTQSTSAEEETEMYLEWCNDFDVNQAQVPDAMVDKLRHFVCNAHAADEHGRKFWRLRRLEDLERQADATSLQNYKSAPGHDAENKMIFSAEGGPSC
ncbi:hypothetical protein NM688_g2665 [Phlebia brevispora]|uniref:Uncharacterized protein n=1 Tax=Phlebia brevispora TaxID=194682 RepID=A0ACC1T859_9APHY|nr:hypothetical protein NM688_g2665 [Phlebia brevispora]